MHTAVHRLNSYLLLIVLLGACTSRPFVIAATPTPEVPQYCKLRVEGRFIKDANGNTVILHGADLPTLREMDSSTRKPEQRLRELADAGARVVRLPVDRSEITPTFVPAVVSPFIDQANALDILVILVYRNDTTETVNAQGDNTEEWLRLALTYLRNAPGVWFQPFDTPIDTSKWQAVNQRMVDVVRGFRADNVMVIGNPTWLKNASPTSALVGANIAYAVDALDGWPLDAAPFILTNFAGANPKAVQAVQVWSIASDATQASKLAELWKSSQTCQR